MEDMIFRGARVIAEGVVNGRKIIHLLLSCGGVVEIFL